MKGARTCCARSRVGGAVGCRVQGVHNLYRNVVLYWKRCKPTSQASQALSADSPINGLVLGHPRQRRNLVSGFPAAHLRLHACRIPRVQADLGDKRSSGSWFVCCSVIRTRLQIVHVRACFGGQGEIQCDVVFCVRTRRCAARRESFRTAVANLSGRAKTFGNARAPAS